MKIAIFIGSDSDHGIVKDASAILKEFKVPFALEVTSAHRTPARTFKLIKEYEEKGVEVFIAVAGKAAHLAGIVAAHTVKPVIGVPVESSSFDGLDALLSTVQMPKGVPVATMALGKTGAVNAALLAIQILGLKDSSLVKKLKDYREKMAAQIEAKSKKIQQKS